MPFSGYMQISVAVIFYKQSQTVDKKWSSTEELGEGLKTPYNKGQCVINVQQDLRIGLFELTYTT
jgi:hypothetical protein